jgi:hypothetical protein
MSGPLRWHRQFKRYSAPDFASQEVASRAYRVNIPRLAMQWQETHSYPAFLLSGDHIVPTRISSKGGMFPIASTAFERVWSLLCGHGQWIPVVDADYYVVGHIGEAPDGFKNVFVPKGRAAGVMGEILEADKPVFVSNGNPDSAQFEAHDEGRVTVYRFLTDPDGKVLALISARSADYLAPPDVDPLLLINLAQIGVAIGKGLVRYLARKAIDKIAALTFRQSMITVEKRLLARGASGEVATIRVLSEEELSMVWGGGTTKPLTDNQLERAIELLRNGQDVHVESIGQMRQIQGELGQLGVRSESSSAMIPQRPAVSKVGKEEVQEIDGSTLDGRGTYRRDPPHGPGSADYTPHKEFPHLNITLRDGKKLAVIVTGSKSF